MIWYRKEFALTEIISSFYFKKIFLKLILSTVFYTYSKLDWLESAFGMEFDTVNLSYNEYFGEK